MRAFFLMVLLFLVGRLHAQERPSDTNAPRTDSVSVKRWSIRVDAVSRYIWRGQSWGGNYPAIQPSLAYTITNKLTIGTWATTNFKKDDYEANGTAPKAYREIDVGLNYSISDFLSVGLWDYYWPTMRGTEDTDRDYFNYGPDGVQTVEASLTVDFSEGYRYAFDATISTFVAGNDYRYNAAGEKPKQNYTTYIEAGYTFANLFGHVRWKPLQDISLRAIAGAVLNNQAEYYTYADYDRPSFVNLGLGAAREFDIGSGIAMPLELNYTHNGAHNNTGLFGRDFLALTVSLSY